jgi:phage gpG-like protein
VSVELTYTMSTKQAQKLMMRLWRRTDSYRSTFNAARVYLGAQYAFNFTSGGSLVGGWPPERPGETWSSLTGFPAYLFETGALLDSLTRLRGQPNDISKKEATFGTNRPYAKFHQYGTEKMPARPVVFVPVDFADLLAKRVAVQWDPKVPLAQMRNAVFAP